MDGTTTLGTVTLSAGLARFTTPALASGRHNIKATYNGGTDFSTSLAALKQMVN
jgi:hypothetical protein